MGKISVSKKNNISLTIPTPLSLFSDKISKQKQTSGVIDSYIYKFSQPEYIKRINSAVYSNNPSLIIGDNSQIGGSLSKRIYSMIVPVSKWLKNQSLSIKNNMMIFLKKNKKKGTQSAGSLMYNINKLAVPVILWLISQGLEINYKGQIFKTNLMLGSDGIDGVSRKFVVGSNSHIKKKKIYRTVSFKDSAYNLSKTILQVLIHKKGYYVIYPTIIKNKKATNYIFVPQNNKTELPTLNNKILNYLIPEDLEWKITYASFNNGEKTSIYKNGLFLFGDAAFPLPPHTAQAGNQILEDAVYIKKLLNENYDFYEIVNMFVKERYFKKDMLAKKSNMVGEILNAQNIAKYFRDYSLKLNGDDLLEKILSPIWTTENYE